MAQDSCRRCALPHITQGRVVMILLLSLFSSASFVNGVIPFEQYYNTLFGPLQEQSLKLKVETLGAILKRHVQQLRSTENRQVDLVFLVDSSASVGGVHFQDEIKFVRKLLADFTVDMNTTRVAVITFSSREKVVRQVDHLTQPDSANHKCSLLIEEMPKIKYIGGGTYTLGAFLEARNVLRAARRDSQKAVFLITDGFSNGGDPRPEAHRLKREGIKIFTFGIRNGNVRELYEMASDPRNETCYVLDSFEEFEALARRALHADLHAGTSMPQPAKKCSGLCSNRGYCCHDNATCTCGTHTGKYECLCKPGYYGNGLGSDGCKPCPAGAYKNYTGSGDVAICTRCPDENQETSPGAVLVHECKCKRGFRNFNSTECTVFRCTELQKPDNGYFVNNQCNNDFNAACGLRCRPGYELRGSGLRICQEDGTWSGQDTECVLKTCPALPAPKNGHMVCTTDDFRYPTVCRFTCQAGYQLLGSRKRSCLAIAFWTGIAARCREISCPPLPEIRDGSIHPPTCTDGEVPFGTTCQLSCLRGYKLRGPSAKQCTTDGTWSASSDEPNQCLDKTPPYIQCPDNIEISSDPENDTTEVTWTVPVAVDNSGFIPELTSDPAVVPPAHFPIGITTVTYRAEDLSQNVARCKFYVLVTDETPPRIDKCFSPEPVISAGSHGNVTWEEPVFTDNSGIPVEIQASHSRGMFPQGHTTVTYTAFDNSGNNNTCVMDIEVSAHPCQYPDPPVNGERKCHESEEGVHCVLSCHPGYAFVLEPPAEYFCAYDNVWTPADQLPFPDCASQEISNEVLQPASITLTGDLSCAEHNFLNRVEQNIEAKVNDKVDRLCEENVICDLEEMQTTCEEHDDYNRINLVARRRRRAAADKVAGGRRLQRASVKFDFTLEGTASYTANNSLEASTQQEKLSQSMKRLLNALQAQAKEGQFDLYLGGRWLRFSDMDFDATRQRNACPEGALLINNSCVLCPVGMFYNVISHQCQSCPKGTYQPTEGQLSCLVCPEKTSTFTKQARSEIDCRAQCLPGSVSPTGLERCETCLEGFYQAEYAQVNCLQCPQESTTLRRGARGIEHCRERCVPGTVSRTGLAPCYPCPYGTYQPQKGQTVCIRCPNDVDTEDRAATSILQCLGLQDLQSDDAGYQNQDQQVVDASECFTNPCRNGGICIPSGKGLFICKCKEGFEGVFCQTEVNQCEARPCLNGGSCSPLPGAYRCVCMPGFEGQKCEKNVDECASSPCQNGATCVDGANSFTCNCRNGFKGVTCEIDVNDCEDQPCMNGGKCEDDVSGYRCTCPEGFSGTTCEIESDECLSAPCRNGGVCVDQPSTYRCDCVDGYTGKQCELEILECASSPCQNGAKCEDLVNRYLCHCKDGFTGAHCESEVDANYQLDFPTAGTADYALLPIDRPLNALTVSFWMKSDDTDNYGTVFSYAVSNADNTLSFTDYNGFAFYVNQESVVTDVSPNDGFWHHLAITWSSVRGSWKVYVDGLLNDSGFDLSTAKPVPGKGLLVLGQEQDSLGGGFSANEAFIGSITQFNIWDEELSLSTIESMRTSCASFYGNVIAWPDVQGALKGSLGSKPTTFCQECPVPADIEFGTSTYTSLTPGSIITYSCMRGFQVAGPSEITCLVTGDYEPPPPTCQRVDCGNPGAIDNGYFSGWRFSFDNRVRYKCQRGYKLRGSDTLYCNEFGDWEGDKPECVEIVCSLPRLSVNTVLSTRKDTPFMPGEIAVLSCAPGHRLLTPHDSVTCQSDGTWDRSVPTCDPQTCSSPPSISNGEPDTVRDEYNVGDIVRYSCEFGYTLNQQGSNPTGAISCLPTGEWESDMPECVLVTCGEPPLVARATISGEDRTFLSRVSYECQPGYAVQGNYALECIETGDWDPDPPQCQPVNCGAPPGLTNGRIEGSDFSFNAVISCSCLPGYKLVGSMRRRCNESGMWEGPDPVCKPVTCGRLSDPPNGRVQALVITFQGEASYLCDEGYNLQGDAARTCSEDATWTGSEPRCQPVSCEAVEDIEHGSYKGPASFTFGARVIYSCLQGYRLDGNSEMVCQSTGYWSNEVPVCLPVECPSPTQPDNGVATSKGTTYTSKVEYVCDPGYNLEGDSIRTCEATGAWSGEDPTCVAITCDPPSAIQNGQYAYKDLKVGSIVSYTCDVGYKLEGLEVRRCQANLTLSDSSPSCVQVTCPSPEAPENGDVTLSRDPLVIGSRASFSCQAGYILAGASVSMCAASGNLSADTPSCRPVECTKPSEIISNGRMLGRNFTFNSTIRYECDQGYRLEGSPQRVCQADGSWNTPIPVCIVVECPRPSIVNGFSSTFRREFGTVVTFTCRPGHQLDGPGERTCTADGSWSGPDPRCLKTVCPPPLPLANGLSRRVNDKTLVYSCNEGYRLEGTNSSSCNDRGLWEPTAPSCVLITCPDISTVRLIKGIVVFKENFRNYGSEVQYLCNTGFTLVGLSQRRCMNTGEWEGDAPVCEIISCPQLGDIVNGRVVAENLTFGAQVSYGCQEGYLLVGVASRMCQADGRWEAEEPRCEPVTCPSVDDSFENGAVSILSNTFGGQVRYTCNLGYILRGESLRECMASGEWSAVEPSCVLLECPEPPALDYGTVVGDDRRIGRSVVYSCNLGYELIGPSALICLPNLLWSGEAPSCERARCVELPPFPFGTIVGEGRRYSDDVSFVCDPGYELVGEYNRSCQANGAWEGEQPECIPVSCGIPPMIDNANADLTNGTLYPAVMTYVCYTGYKSQGSGIASCLETGLWSTPDLVCELVTCSEILPDDLYDGTIQANGFSYGEIVYFTCNIGFRLIGSNSATCSADGVWSSEIPICEIVTCLEPEPILQGVVTVDGNEYNDTAVYRCNTGYNLSGQAVARCIESGEWSREARECLLVTCQSPPAIIPNGRLMESKPIFVYQDQAQYQCDSGYELVGTALLTCSEAGSFVPRPPSCAKIQCPSPRTPSWGNVDIVNDTLFYSCVPGYELAGTPVRRCLQSGQWDGTAPVCIPILCSPPASVANGFFQGIDFQFGGSVSYSCNKGFRLHGDRNRTCLLNQQWSGVDPTCERVVCGAPRSVEFGTILGEDFTYNHTVSYQCQFGFVLIGQAERTCLETGQWSGEDPYCDEIMCDAPPAVADAKHDGSSPSALFSFGSLVMYMCDAGHVMTGASSIVCQGDGTWSEPLPSCPPVTCPEVPKPEHGHLTGEDVTFGAEVTVSCGKGYRLKGPGLLICTESGLWDEEFPVCEQIRCAVTEIKFGRALVTGQSASAYVLPGQRIEFTCFPGFRLGGASSSMCLENGNWTNRFPVCLPVTCGAPSLLRNGSVTQAVIYHAGDSVTYKCTQGFELEGDSVLVCGNDGSWEGTHPQCVDVVCDEPPEVEHAIVIGQGPLGTRSTRAGGSIRYECLVGFSFVGNHNGRLSCLRGGSWSSDVPRCVHTDCGPPPVPFRASVTTTGSTAGSVATVRCNSGFSLPNGGQVLEVICDVSGTWAGAENVRCVQVDCGQPPKLVNSVPFEVINTTYGNRVSYTCLPGYELTGNAIIQCSQAGVWTSTGGQLPACQPVVCGPPETDARVSGREFTFASTLTLTCPVGMRLVGSESITCLADAQWSPAPGRCQTILCPAVTVPDNGYLFSGTAADETEVGESVEILCQEGFSLAGDPVVTCLPNGTWSGPVPSCYQPKDRSLTCARSVDKENTLAPLQDYFPGDRVVLSCRPGYRPEGDMTSLCQNDKTWAAPSGLCVRVSCGPPQVQNRKDVMVLGRSYLYGDRVMYMCRPGLSPVRLPPTLTCTESGQWDREAACAAQCKFPCQNGGRCAEQNKCKCTPGYTGLQCQFPICILPCLNDGVCQAPFSCRCPPGYQGSRCHKAICDQACQNGGRCLRPNRCQCFNGFKPPFCQTKWFPDPEPS